MAMRKKVSKAPKTFNREAQWKAYRALRAQIDKAWEKLRADVRKKASSDVLMHDNNQLLLLLGECNYMARECSRMAIKNKKKGR